VQSSQEHEANHLLHMGELLSRKLSKNLKQRMIQTLIRSVVKDMEQIHGPREKLSKCEHGEEYTDSVRQNIKQIWK